METLNGRIIEDVTLPIGGCLQITFTDGSTLYVGGDITSFVFYDENNINTINL